MTSPTVKRVVYVVLAVAFLAFHAYYTRTRSEHRPSSAGLSENLLRISDHEETSLEEILPDLRKVPLVFVGELHDQASHHWAQLQVIRRLHDANVKVAIGLEMIRADYQKSLDQWVRGEISEKQFVPIFERNWSRWDLYGDIFRFGREHGIPMVGLNVSPKITRKVAREGFSSLSEEQLKDLPPVRCDVDAVYQDFIRRALGEGVKPAMSFQHFCEAQLVWDGAMAWHLEQFLQENPGYTVVVLAGSGHSWKRGIPEQIRRRTDFAFRVILPETERLNRATATTEDADYLWLGLPVVSSL
jgi:uncharacterized iron-regulated protein